MIDKTAWSRPNPVTLLAKRVPAELPVATADPTIGLLRTELRVLSNLAEEGSPAAVFVQTQAAWGWCASSPTSPFNWPTVSGASRSPPRRFPSSWRNWHAIWIGTRGSASPRFWRSTGCRISASGAPSARRAGSGRGLPTAMCSSPMPSRSMSPGATSGELPVLHYSLTRNQPGNFRVAGYAKKLSARGAAATLTGLSGPVRTLYLTVATVELHQRMKQHLGNGHAVYYC